MARPIIIIDADAIDHHKYLPRDCVGLNILNRRTGQIMKIECVVGQAISGKVRYIVSLH